MPASQTVCQAPPFDALAAAPGEWFVLHTRSRQEKALAADLTARGVSHFLPLVRQTKYYGRRKILIDMPLFPGYLFLHGDRTQVHDADRTRRVAQILPVSNQRQIEWELRNLSLAISQDAKFDAHPFLKRGVRVEVRAGPFRGLQGVVDHRLSASRLALQVVTLGRGVSLEVDSSLLDPIE